MENSLNEFSIGVFAIQMGIIFLICFVVHHIMKFKKRRLEQELNDDFNESL